MIFQPHDYQNYCIQRIIDQEKVGLFLDMGLGKTVITLTAISDLRYERFAVRKVLVVAPKKVAESTWSREAAKWEHLKFLKILPVLGTAAKRLKAIYTPADCYVINRENVPWLVDLLRNDWPFDMVVLDESSSFKNHKAKRFKSLKAVLPKITRLVELTGTPAPNGLLDLWAQIFLLDGGEALGKTFGGFRERYFMPDQRDREHIFSYKAKSDAKTAILDKLSALCVSMKAEDYLKLPDCITVDVPVELDKTAKDRYLELERTSLLELSEGIIDAGSAAVLTGKLLQLCGGALYDSDRQVISVHDCKIEAFLELLEGLNGQHTLVFYSFQHEKSRILEALKPLNLAVRELNSPADETAWNNGEVDILLAHPASCAYGLNLQNGGHNVIWFGLSWSLELYQQANKRLHRQGQEHPVIIHRLLTVGGMDEDVAAALEGKEDTQESLLKALKARIERVKG